MIFLENQFQFIDNFLKQKISFKFNIVLLGIINFLATVGTYHGESEADAERRRKTEKKLVLYILAFIIFWLPGKLTYI